MITHSLVRSAFIKHDPSSTTKLNGILKSHRDLENGVDEGMDGIIVYGSEGGAKMMSLTTGKPNVSSFDLPANKGHPPSNSDIELAFCHLLPPITRQP
ncbi:hypothetical protein [Variovorax rhizosphaerae]|uniref:Uncharacterized protein n=1 Tax=Variovorax rhizosphaerae TaxID=1836200 RepID=A0ABU8WW33_9BURK